MNETELIKLLKTTANVVESLYLKVHIAGRISQLIEGTYHRPIEHGMEAPLRDASRNLSNAADTVRRADIGSEYSILRILEGKNAINTYQEAKKILDSIDPEKLQRLHDDADAALGQDLEQSILQYAKALSRKEGIGLTEEEKAELKPVIMIEETLKSYSELKLHCADRRQTKWHYNR